MSRKKEPEDGEAPPSAATTPAPEAKQRKRARPRKAVADGATPAPATDEPDAVAIAPGPPTPAVEPGLVEETPQTAEPPAAEAQPPVPMPAPVVEPQPEAESTPEPAPPAAAPEHDLQLVVCVLADEHYGVNISAVDSIIKLQPITFVPHAPAFVEGVTNLRGKVLPVVDLRRRLSLPAGEATKETRIMVAQVGGMNVGLVVDHVSEVRRVPAEAIEPPSPLVVPVDSAFTTGIAKVEDRLITVLDLHQVLSPEGKADLHATPAWPGGTEP